jgi:hypothetical protein
VNELGERLTDVVEGARDLTRRLEVRRRDEIGHLARQFNRFLAGLQDGLREAAKASHSVALVADDVAGAGRAQRRTVTILGASTQRIVSGVRQISTGRRRSRGRTRGRGGRSCLHRRLHGRQAGPGGDGPDDGGPRAGDPSMGSGSPPSRGLASTITGIVSTMVKVTDRTNLLSVNAAVEAEKAGPHGRGFRVVAEEIRRLSDETAEATLRIEASVKSMQGAVTSGVGEMQGFSARVDGALRTTGRVARQVAAVAERVEGLGVRFASLEEAVAEQSVGAGEIRGPPWISAAWRRSRGRWPRPPVAARRARTGGRDASRRDRAVPSGDGRISGVADAASVVRPPDPRMRERGARQTRHGARPPPPPEPAHPFHPSATPRRAEWKRWFRVAQKRYADADVRARDEGGISRSLLPSGTSWSTLMIVQPPSTNQ